MVPPKRLLIVEDTAAVSRLLSRSFEQAGYAALVIDRASDLPAALDTGAFHAALVDVDLPEGADGVVVAQRLTRLRPEMLVVVMSGDHRNLERAGAAGLTRVLPKPFTQAELFDAVDLISG
ncbi:MAG: response regulator [Elusimicrobia bacterium]|nr:response regulator [Elusimicrobiota bacterium]